MGRLISYTEAETLNSDDYLIIDGTTDGTRKIKAQMLFESDEIENLKNYNSYDVLMDATHESWTHNGITYTWDTKNKVCTALGTASARSRSRFFVSNNSLPEWITPGGTYYIKIQSTGDIPAFYIAWYVDGTMTYERNYIANAIITVPSNITGFVATLQVPTGCTVDGTISVQLLTGLSNQEIDTELKEHIFPKKANSYVSSNTITLGDIREDGRYIIDASWTATDAPSYTYPSSYVLIVENHSPSAIGEKFVKQTIQGLMAGLNKTFCRMRQTNTWGDWVDVSPMREDVLLPTGDTTDRKNEIEAILTAKGICILAPGDYYISNIVMPDNSTLKGSGIGRTNIIMITGETGACVSIGTHCGVSDFSIYGQDSEDHSTDNDRHGLGWIGTFVSESSPGTYPVHSMASNLYIEGFKGGGIFCNATSMRLISGLQVNNVICIKCYAGVYIKKYSEFSQFSNVKANECTYGCINNGGNNVFSNCNFSGNVTGLLMDNTGSQSPNNSHGSFVGCVFNHSGSNEGYAMTLIGLDSGEMFVGCQVFYGKTSMAGCTGVRFVGCNYGRKTGISVSGSHAITYDSCQFREATDTPVTQSSSIGFKFRNCMLYDGTDFDPLTP